MNRIFGSGYFRKAGLCAALGTLGACMAPPPPPPPPAPPPPPPPAPSESVPYRPLPPLGAAYDIELPPKGADGLRVTVNSNLDRDSTLWHFRSAWNVAALNCRGAVRETVLEAYGRYLKRFKTVLDRTNTGLEKRYQAEHPEARDALKAREAYMTRVYNYFAMPPVRGDFCNMMEIMANDYLASPTTDPWVHSGQWLPRLESVFQEFFRTYEQYQVASSAWDAKWGELFGETQPGWVAVHREPGASQPAVVREVLDPDTGARIPVIEVPTAGPAGS